MKKAIAALLGALTAGWLGLRVPPKRFPPYPEWTKPLDALDLPDGLPPPVARYYRTVMGERVPVVTSAVISGLARLRIGGIPFPSRFRFVHVAGRDYRHYIESTFFGLPIFRVNEHYLDGRSQLELPFGLVENEPKVDAAANLGLWGESVWLPSIWLTDPRIRWEPVNAKAARLIVPFRDEGEDVFDVTFDAATGLILRMEAMRWKQPGDTAKTPWRNEPLGWKTFHGVRMPSPAAVTWMDEGTPWAIFDVREVIYNADVSDYIRSRGI